MDKIERQDHERTKVNLLRIPISKSSKRHKRRKFLNTILVWIIVAMLLPLSTFALIAYNMSGQAILNNEYQANKKILFQVKYNIDYMDDMILNSVISLYYNPEIRSIMYSEEIDFIELMKEINSLQTSIVNSNPFIRSIYLYNRKSDTYYTTTGELLFKDANFDKLLHSGREIPILKPIPRKMEYEAGGSAGGSENVVSYFMYDFKDDNNLPMGALIVNASTDWLLQNIDKVNLVDQSKQEEVIILDQETDIVGHDPEQRPLLAAMRQSYLDYRDAAQSDEPTGYFRTELDGETYLITYANVEKMNWTLIKAQKFDQVFRKVDALKTTFLVTTCVFLTIAIVIAVLISRRIYRPIGDLVKRVGHAEPLSRIGEPKDEFTYLNEAFRHSIDLINEYHRRKSSEQEVMKSYFLRKLLIDSTSMTEQERDQAADAYRIALDFRRPMVVCIVKIDDYQAFRQKLSPFDQSLCAFGITNISTELLGGSYPCEAVDMKNDFVAFIVNAAGPSEELEGLWKQAQHYIEEYFHLSVSVFIGDPANDCRELSEKYYEALNGTAYRMLFGKSCILTNEKIRGNEENGQLGYSAALEKKLTEAIKSGNTAEGEEALSKIFAELSGFSYNNAMFSAMNLVNSIKATVEELNRAKVEPVRVNFGSLTKRLYEAETLAEFHRQLLALLKDILSKAESAESEKQTILVEAIRELIEADYANPAMCLQFVADKLGTSSKTVSRLFNARMNLSVADYITETRLAKAVEWMESTNLTTKEILQKIGVENESYFYKLFKKKYGTTPKEYVLSRNLQRIQDKE